jgi:hypothetical protein
MLFFNALRILGVMMRRKKRMEPTVLLLLLGES